MAKGSWHGRVEFPLLIAGLVLAGSLARTGPVPSYSTNMEGSARQESSSQVLSHEADLLIVGGTESGLAAAIQAARMGVERIVVVSDTPWLGGQFTAESLVAIDENRGPEGYGHGVPFPRHGLFLELIDRIEATNLEQLGKARPGNTRVITTCRPGVALAAWEQLLEPYIESGQLTILTSWHLDQVLTARDHDNGLARVTGASFVHAAGDDRLRVEATITIDASDWGDVVRESGTPFMFGPDLRSDFGEPLAPTDRETYPLTDMNPITQCVLLEWSEDASVIAEPDGYDARCYRDHGYPDEPRWIYESRRIVDSTDPAIRAHTPDAADVVLLCFPTFDYPLDVLPGRVAARLEQMAPGTSQKNIVLMSREQRQTIFDDARRHALGFLYFMQTEGAAKYPGQAELFRHLRLVDDFGTADHLPPKPYIRESLRTRTLYVMRQQDTTGFRNRSTSFAQAMYHDGIGCWQFEYDFHPTRREFLTEDEQGPWRAAFRPGRTWGPPYAGRSLLAARALIPRDTRGLLVAQKNLGYTSLVSSALRLHDQSMMVGQGAGAIAAVALNNGIELDVIPGEKRWMREIWIGLVNPPRQPRVDEANSASWQPAMLWPFDDLEPEHEAFRAVQLLAAHRVLPVSPWETSFAADDMASDAWRDEMMRRASTEFPQVSAIRPPDSLTTRGELAIWYWDQLREQVPRPWIRRSDDDADLDGIPDGDDALPFENASTSWEAFGPGENFDGRPPTLPVDRTVAAINFAGPATRDLDGWSLDSGRLFDEETGRGWLRDIQANHRDRQSLGDPLADTFLFTRTHDVFEIAVDNGDYRVHLCIGDSQYEQTGQNLTVENQSIARDVTTVEFEEYSAEVSVTDGRLTVGIGLPGGTTNTCLNWLIVERLPSGE